MPSSRLFKTSLLILSLFIITPFAKAQSDDPINTDRPDQSDGTYILTRHTFQAEEGVLLADQTVINNFMLRYGVTNSTEVRLSLDAGKTGTGRGLLPVSLSAKQRIIRQKKWIPAITLVGYLGFEKLASPDFSGNGLPAVVKLAFQNDLSDNLAIGYNIGTSTWLNDMLATLSVGYSPFNKTTVFVEYFGNYNALTAPAHNIDGGIMYLLNNHLQVDVAAGHSVFDQTDPRWFFTTGVSYRFD